MEYFFNDLSIHTQFHQLADFQQSVSQIMLMRNKCAEYGFSLMCNEHLTTSQVTPSLNMQQAIQQFNPDQRRDFMLWLTKTGPFWNSERFHPANEYLECKEQVVTDSALGEAAFCIFHSRPAQMISLTPSLWEESPFQVFWVQDDQTQQEIGIVNHIQMEILEESLRSSSKPVDSWNKLQNICFQRFTQLIFASDAFSYLDGHPFVFGAANAIIERLNILNQLKTCFDESGQRTAVGHELIQKHFTGVNAWFSDSSDTECHQFQGELTFKHPEDQGQPLFCPWHGKVKTPQIRIHFSWPLRANETLYVVYVGPKITKV